MYLALLLTTEYLLLTSSNSSALTMYDLLHQVVATSARWARKATTS